MQNYKFHHSINVKVSKLTKEVQYSFWDIIIELCVNFLSNKKITESLYYFCPL